MGKWKSKRLSDKVTATAAPDSTVSRDLLETQGESAQIALDQEGRLNGSGDEKKEEGLPDQSPPPAQIALDQEGRLNGSGDEKKEEGLPDQSPPQVNGKWSKGTI